MVKFAYESYFEKIMTHIEREQQTVARMIAIYCRHHHGTRKGELCAECGALKDYAIKRLSCCPYGNAKSSCRKCPIHCYSPDNKTRIREVMRYVGPRMLFSHPIAAIRHLCAELR